MFDSEREFDDNPLEFRGKIDELGSYLLCVSTVYPHKNYDTLLRAWSLLPVKLREENRLVIAGTLIDEKYADRLFRLAAELGITDQIEFLGRVPYRLVPYLYANASAFVFPSYLETFGHPLVEAMAMGVPIVASKSTCIPEIVCEAASLFDSQNPHELASKIEQVMCDQAWRRTLIHRGKRRASDFSWRIAAQKVLQIFKSIAQCDSSKGKIWILGI
jgi:glycosyltransferase involved in cell wall biosynthesis